ncbi:hypothetical protein L1887_60336 [Cichorium endivia]|nr:hypothetical protein L1887_60336 [Cichorium endivia]
MLSGLMPSSASPASWLSSTSGVGELDGSIDAVLAEKVMMRWWCMAFAARTECACGDKQPTTSMLDSCIYTATLGLARTVVRPSAGSAHVKMRDRTSTSALRRPNRLGHHARRTKLTALTRCSSSSAAMKRFHPANVGIARARQRSAVQSPHPQAGGACTRGQHLQRVGRGACASQAKRACSHHHTYVTGRRSNRQGYEASLFIVVAGAWAAQ